MSLSDELKRAADEAEATRQLVEQLRAQIDAAEAINGARALVAKKMPRLLSELDDIEGNVGGFYDETLSKKQKKDIEDFEKSVQRLKSDIDLFKNANPSALARLKESVDSEIADRLKDAKEILEDNDKQAAKIKAYLNSADNYCSIAAKKIAAGELENAENVLKKAESEAKNARSVMGGSTDAVSAYFESKVEGFDNKIATIRADIKTAKSAAKKVKEASRPTGSLSKPKPLESEGAMPSDVSALSIGNELGGHSGANATKVTDANGNAFVMKTSGSGVSAECLRNEAQMDEFYRAAGIAVPECTTIKDGGEVVKLSRFVKGRNLYEWWASASKKERDAMKAKLRAGFAADCLLGNWDVAGAVGDNILIDKDGNPWRIDNGGAGAFRATGPRKKPDEWSASIKQTGSDGVSRDGAPVELWSMADSRNNKQYFGGITPSEICHDIAKTDWSEALSKLEPSERKVVEARIDRCRELDKLQVLDSVGVTQDNAAMFLEGCRNYGSGAYTQKRMDGAEWFSKKKHSDPVAAAHAKLSPSFLRHWAAASAHRQTGSVSKYTGAAYGWMNSKLRRSEHNADNDRVIDFLNDEQNKGDIWLMRGVGTGSDPLQNGLKPFVDGGIPDSKTFRANPNMILGKGAGDKAFMSCTPIKGEGFGSRNVILNIFCPDGAKMAFVDEKSIHKGEEEMLLQAGSRFVITKVEVKGDKTFVDCSLIGQYPQK